MHRNGRGSQKEQTGCVFLCTFFRKEKKKKKEKAQEWLRSISLPALYHTKHKMVLRSYGGDICAKENSSMTMCCIHAYKQSSLDLGWEFSLCSSS